MRQVSHSHHSLKERQRQEREALILQVAEDVLLEKGYYETSMDEIAARVGIAKGTVYLHFPGKEELVAAIFSRDFQAFSQELEAMMASDLTARARLEAILHFMYCGFFSKRTQLLYTIYNNADLRRLFVEKGGCMRDIWEDVASQVSEVLDEGKASGEFDPGIPTNVMVNTFFSIVSPRSYERLIVRDGMVPEEMIKYLGRIYFDGVAKR